MILPAGLAPASAPALAAMSSLRPISPAEFDDWWAAAVPTYAEDKVVSGAWPAAGAVERAAGEFAALLPQGRETPNHHVFTIVGPGGAPVGALWFAIERWETHQVAYVYNILVRPGHRRQGHARRAFLALEPEVRRRGASGIALHVFAHNAAAKALYAQLGFQSTHFNLYKPVGDAAG